MPDLVLARLPGRLAARHERVIECLLEMNDAGYIDAVWQCIQMCDDIRAHGHQSQFVRSLQGVAGIFELKPTTRTGQRGGARIYGFWLSDGRPVLVTAEYKEPGNDPLRRLIEEAVDVLIAVKRGRLTP